MISILGEALGFTYLACQTMFFLDFSVDLSEAIDVYSEWIDACEQANE